MPTGEDVQPGGAGAVDDTPRQDTPGARAAYDKPSKDMPGVGAADDKASKDMPGAGGADDKTSKDMPGSGVSDAKSINDVVVSGGDVCLRARAAEETPRKDMPGAEMADNAPLMDVPEGENICPRTTSSNNMSSQPVQRSDSTSSETQPEDDVKGTSEEEEFIPPDDELSQKIIDQVEFYFSDVNITKDAFLLKHVKRNKEGYVSLKLISSFKRVKHLAKDWRVVAYALAKSKKLEINEAGTKLRRIDPLPPYDQTTPSRTVVAIDLPLEKPTIESVAEMFRSCGEIALIRILRPGNPIPADVRNFFNKHPEMNGKVSALVEFERTESAHNALNKEFDWRHTDSMQVLELNAPPSAEKKRKIKKLTKSFDDYSSSCASGSEVEDRRYRLQRRCSSPHLSNDHWHQRRWSRDSGTDSSGSYPSSRSRSNSGVFFVPDYVRRMSSDSESYNSRSRTGSRVSMSDIRRLSISSKESDCFCCHGDCGRRGSLSSGKDSGSEGYGSGRSRTNSGASDSRRGSIEYYCSPKGKDTCWDHGRRPSREPESKNRENVIRLPRGPDGGRGFLPSKPSCHTLIE